MFYGEYEHTMDKKGRLIIPSRYRDVFKERYIERLYITRGLDRCLFVFTEEDWRVQEKKFKEMSFTNQESRKFNRLFFAGACDAAFDGQGRILIPDYLLQYAEIKESVMVVGVLDRFEIWSKEKWKDFYTTSMESFEDIAEKLLDPGKQQDKK